MLTQEQREFFAFFSLRPPSTMTAEGAKRFMDAFLRDPERLQRWQARNGAPATPPAPAAPLPPVATAVPARVATAHHVHPRDEHIERGFRFTGSGAEYFGIWIVNLLLTIVTVGIYAAWAKVRRLQYFYRHTELAGASFDYHGEGLAIFKGRVIAIGLFLLYNFSFSFSPALGIATLALLAVALPWLLRNSFRFRLRNSSYRGLRFRFAGSTPEAYWTFLARPLVVFFSLYLAAPWFHQRLKRYQHGNSAYGKTPFAFSATVGQFYREYALLAVLALFAFAVPAIMVFQAFADLAQVQQQTGAPPDPRVLSGKIFTALVVMMVGMLALTPVFQARLQNLVWNRTTLGPHRFKSECSAWQLFLIHVTNALLIVVTLGFYLPWAAVRVAEYRIGTLAVITEGSFDDFVAQQGEDLGATGEETAEVFDIDIAL
jgi:uncharacterized membrane protein YjgN (DUF898 family)